jgi:hypothetical protein
VDFDRIRKHLDDSFRVEGKCIQFGINNIPLFETICKFGHPDNKHVIGVGKPNVNLNNRLNRINVNNYEVNETFPENTKLCFAAFDLSTPYDITKALAYVWDNIEYSGSILVSEYSIRQRTPSNDIFERFISLHKNELNVSRQMLIDGKREKHVVIKCFPKNKKPTPIVSDTTITIAAVLKSGGGIYDVNYVNHIASAIYHNTTKKYKFVCLTDITNGFNEHVHVVKPLIHDFPGWWSKIELFKPGMFDTDRVFYFDLDTMIVGNIDHMLDYGGDLYYLRDFYSQVGLASGIMAWKNNSPNVFKIYEKFMESPSATMKRYHGDQEFISPIIGKFGDYVQDLYPKQILSYKKDCIEAYTTPTLPSMGRILCFHGNPRPHQITNSIFKKYWMGS